MGGGRREGGPARKIGREGGEKKEGVLIGVPEGSRMEGRGRGG